jgi:phosphatidylglycerol:prolipoprotein diacylglycerol transferase
MDQATYRLFVLVAASVGGLLIFLRSRSWPLSGQQKLLVFSAASSGALVGAAIPGFFAGGWAELGFPQTPAALFAWPAWVFGPKTVVGGLLGSFLLVALVKRLYQIGYDTSDAFALGTAAILPLGRLGCIFNHCCAGIPWRGPENLSVVFADGSVRFPAAHLEFAFGLTLFIAIFRLEGQRSQMHRRLFWLFAVYGTGRFFLEFLRQPVSETWLGMSIYHVLALALAVTGGYQIQKRSRIYLNF